MVINVTQAHIKDGKPLNVCACPVAKAINPLLPSKWYAAVKPYEAGIWNMQHELIESLDLPIEAQQFIVNFDMGRIVEPFSFELPIDELLNG